VVSEGEKGVVIKQLLKAEVPAKSLRGVLIASVIKTDRPSFLLSESSQGQCWADRLIKKSPHRHPPTHTIATTPFSLRDESCQLLPHFINSVRENKTGTF
jgi:hypothetical protein